MKIDADLKFELKAKAFENMRWMLAPGKTQAFGASEKLRAKEWAEWNDTYGVVFGHFIKALEEVVP